MSEFGDRGSWIGDRDRFDTAIDLAVREMLDVEPPAGLRGRVLDRIDPSPNSVASAFRRKDNFKRKIAWIAVPVAAAAIIVLAVMLPFRTDRASVGPVTTVATNQNPPQPPTPGPTVTPDVRPDTVTAGRSTPPLRPQQTVRAAVAPDEAAADVVWIDALAAPAAMAVAPMAPPPAPAVPSIDLAPAQIPALEVRPISDTPRERRNQE